MSSDLQLFLLGIALGIVLCLAWDIYILLKHEHERKKP